MALDRHLAVDDQHLGSRVNRPGAPGTVRGAAVAAVGAPRLAATLTRALTRQYAPPRALDALVDARLARVLHVAATRPFYRDARGLSVAPGTAALPRARLGHVQPLERSDLLDHAGGICDLAVPAVVQSTSGTLGAPLQVRAGRDAHREWGAIWLRAHLATGLRPWHHMVYVKNRQEPPGALDALRLFPSTWCPVDATPDQVVAAVRARRAVTLGGYPSALLTIAQEVDTATLRALDLRWITSGSETLTDAARATIERAFGARVHDLYGSVELGSIAFECARGRMHVNADSVLVEVVRPDGTPADPCESGEILVTGLVDTVTPLVRYRIGDRGAIDARPGRCGCGRTLPVLTSLEGRTANRLVGPRGSLSEAALSGALSGLAPLRRYQFQQAGDGALRCRYVGGEESPRLVAAMLAERIGPVPIVFERVTAIPRSASGKSHTIVRAAEVTSG